MELETIRSYDWGIMAPELIILGAATILSLADLLMPKKASRRYLAIFAFLGVACALVALFMQLDNGVISILADTYRFDSFSKAFKLLFLIGTGLILLLAFDDRKGERDEYRGEFYYLLLTALLGAMMMASSADMITLFVGLELLSLSSYIMAGLRKRDRQSNEAAFKYVVNGGISTAITLFGMSYIFGLTGETNLYAIQNALGDPTILQNQFLLVFAFLITFVGLSFKIATVPFQMWAPDVYHGAPIPVTAFLSVVSKAAGFVIMIRFLLVTFIAAPGVAEKPLLQEVQPYLAILAGASMIIGNLIALRQRNIKRMFAYSSIAQAGYILVPFAVISGLMFEAVWFYLLAYLFMNIGVFAIIQLVTAKSGSTDISSFAGLYRRSPWIAVCMTIFVLSLAGFPATAGFIGKFGIFMSALSTGAHYWLAGIMIATTVVSYFYYFNVIGQMFFRSEEEAGKVSIPGGVLTVTAVCVISTLVLGILPHTALEFFYNQFDLSQFFTPTK
ncbi:NADH-quinone oxidoreductase subunit NuoN [Fictibacillus gelatini]|uniref:NADH-quinone oxidoreductase subunit NuoN n=1 Tax=Fictibacillus gelatini TaxID=225985 RepID=UPI00040E4CAA|nr:NADH-quinone oxidoreductase subunit NuoN [Fictibacillus gelatini]